MKKFAKINENDVLDGAILIKSTICGRTGIAIGIDKKHGVHPLGWQRVLIIYEGRITSTSTGVLATYFYKAIL